MRYFTDSILLLLYSTLTFFYVPADQALVFALLFAVIVFGSSSVFPAAAVSDLICRAFSSGSGCASTLGISGFSDQ